MFRVSYFFFLKFSIVPYGMLWKEFNLLLARFPIALSKARERDQVFVEKVYLLWTAHTSERKTPWCGDGWTRSDSMPLPLIGD